MEVFLCFVAMMVTVSADYGVDHLTKVSCDNITQDRMRNEMVMQSECAIREVLLVLAPPTVYEAVDPGTLWVKRCVGGCLTSLTEYACHPHASKRIQVPVSIYNVKTNRHICSKFTIEEHVSCRCELPHTTCAPKEMTIEVDRPRTGPVHPGLGPEPVWIKRCVGKCGEYDKKCVPLSATYGQVLTGTGQYSAEFHTSCGCAPEEFMGPCELIRTYIMGSYFAVDQCRGTCLNPEYACRPVKTRLANMPKTGEYWPEHVECLCAKLEEY